MTEQTSVGDELNAQTSSETPGEGTPQSEPKGEGTPTTEPEMAEEKKTPEVDYKKKFSESSKENQRITEENEQLRKEAQWVKNLRAMGYSPEDIDRYIATGGSKELDSVKLQRDLEEVKKNQILQKEEIDLERTLKEISDAAPFKETLRTLGRSYPGKTFKDLWAEHIEPALKAGQELAYKKLEVKKKTQVESGKGSGETRAELSFNDFKKLSPAEMAKYLRERGM